MTRDSVVGAVFPFFSLLFLLFPFLRPLLSEIRVDKQKWRRGKRGENLEVGANSYLSSGAGSG